MCLTKIRLNKAFSLGGRVVGMVVNYSGTSLYHRKVSFAHRPRGTSKNGDLTAEHATQSSLGVTLN